VIEKPGTRTPDRTHLAVAPAAMLVLLARCLIEGP
jgi:hypothetical protein